MNGLRKTILFGSYILVTGGILLYLLFPADAVRDHLASRINQRVSNAQVAIGSLHLRFPLSLALEDVTVFTKDAILFSVDRMKLSPRWHSLLSRRKSFRFRGQTCQGEISGSFWAEVKRDGLEASASGTFSEIRIELLPVMARQPQLGMTGTASGSFQIAATPMQPATGTGNIVVSDCNLIFPETLSDIQRLLNIRQLEFERIDADIDFEGSGLEIQRCELEGSQLRGSVSGSVFVASPMPRSDMDLEFSVTPLLSSALSEINEITFRVTGTFENPVFSLVPTR